MLDALKRGKAIAAILPALAFWFLVVQGGPAHAQQGTLTLACKGATYAPLFDQKPDSVSMGIIVDFTAGIVQGFLDDDDLTKITAADNVKIMFGSSKIKSGQEIRLVGSIDRVTGDVEAAYTVHDLGTKVTNHMTYSLQCRPKQRMF